MPRKGTRTLLQYRCRLPCRIEKLDAPEGDENTRFPDSCWNRRSTIEKLDAPEGDENARAQFFLSFFFKLRN